jgi:hypothetical protein
MRGLYYGFICGKGKNFAKNERPKFRSITTDFRLNSILIFNDLYVNLGFDAVNILPITRVMAARTGVEPVYQP